MNLAFPRNNNSEMLLYIWKIIDLPYISFDDLFYKISFDLFLLSPDKAIDFINTCIDKKLIIKDNDYNLKLSKDLSDQLKNWQKIRKNSIIEKINSAKKIAQLKNDIDKKDLSNFGLLINAFVDKGTLNRSVTVSDAAFDISEYNRLEGIIKSKVKGSKEESYIIEINTNDKILRHNCHDFETRRADNKKFCKHIAKLFLILKEKNNKSAEYFLNQLAEDIDKWEFIT
ncbi:MAG: hypothetical protein ACFE9Q_15780 [Candidatus Hodarchaeota archaeon]